MEIHTLLYSSSPFCYCFSLIRFPLLSLVSYWSFLFWFIYCSLILETGFDSGEILVTSGMEDIIEGKAMAVMVMVMAMAMLVHQIRIDRSSSLTSASSPPTNICKKHNFMMNGRYRMKVVAQKKRERLTVALFDSLSDWEPWATAPFGACPPANTKANKKDSINIMIQIN